MNAVMKSPTDNWSAFLVDVAEGVDMVEAMTKNLITRKDVARIVASNHLEAQRWADAQAQAMRSRWDQLDIDEIMARVARGTAIRQAVIQVRGQDDTGEFYLLIGSFKDIDAAFEKAQKARALAEDEVLLGIADDDSKDILDNGKGGQQGNVAAVNRSRLKWDARRAFMASADPDRFGERKNQVAVQVNINHAERLERANEQLARGRAGLSAALPKTGDLNTSIQLSREERARAIDATFVSEQPVPSRAEKAKISRPMTRDELRAHGEAKAVDTDTSWKDEKPSEAEASEPVSTVWLEGN